ncbi:MAG: glycerol-3-phosphate ABC transporter ATP-binding protein, partial [Anaerolineales bacterium]|nr:glycerol-3-phosphate ABC transporter ATP-binding protein [Anaerolineales bacterium]
MLHKNVVKKFGDLTTIANLNITVEDKEFLVLVGSIRLRKTTALRLLAGLEEISDGE